MRIRKYVAGAAAAVVLVLAGHVTAHTPTAHDGGSVATFNDGFTESKSDDCEMGFDPACSWLAESH
jgi:hypothetical protein